MKISEDMENLLGKHELGRGEKKGSNLKGVLPK
jgi:hypothetical protein